LNYQTKLLSNLNHPVQPLTPLKPTYSLQLHLGPNPLPQKPTSCMGLFQ
jgi:hypothetical protein